MLMVGKGQLGAGERIPLWPEGRMPSVCTNQSVAPYVECFTPEKRTGDAVLVIMPGGGYGGWADAVEGVAVREYFLAKGVPCALLRYRTPRPAGLPRHLTAWQDAQRAVRIVRREAASRGWSPENIGVMGFSAGERILRDGALPAGTPAKGRLGIRSKNGKLLMRQIKVKEDAELGNKANRYALNSQPQQGD